MKKVLSLATLLFLSGQAQAKTSEIATTQFPELNINSLHDKELAREKKGEAPHFAIPREVSIKAFSSEDSIQQKGNSVIWRHRIQAKNAVSLNFAFEKFSLPKGAKLNIYSYDLSQSIRSFTSLDNNKENQLWTPVILSNDVVIEVIANSSNVSNVVLELTKVNQGFRTFSQSTLKSGSCNVDVVCSEGDDWRKEINSVAVISTGGRTFCTGFMVNNAKNDKTPFFMTANHCRLSPRNASSLVTYWNYQSAQCGGSRNGRKLQFNTGATHIASSSKSDFTLLKLNKMPPAQANVTYAGWDRRELDARTAIAIHHPNTDEKAISFEYDGTTVTSYLSNDVPGDSTHVRVTDWDVGTTEPGSSGSPLFNEEHRVIGQLHGGHASCTSQTSDWYGRINTSWEGDNTPSSRLKDHLDPEQTGIEYTDTI